MIVGSKGFQSAAASVALLVPTLNRSDFLIRFLNYYQALSFPGLICIGDSSGAEHFNTTCANVAKLGSSLNILHLALPGQNISACFVKMAEAISQPYVAFVGDDDYLVPSGIEKCIAFLEQHPDYAGVHGEAINVVTSGSGPRCPISSVCHYSQPVLEHPTSAERFMRLFLNYGVSLFSIHRRATWHHMFKDTPQIPDQAFRDELIACALSVISGKIGSLDCLYLIRQCHDRRNILMGLFDWITSPNFSSSYHSFLEIVSRDLALSERVPLKDAQNLVRESLGFYLSYFLARQYLKLNLEVPGAVPPRPWTMEEILSPEWIFAADLRPVLQSLAGQLS